MKIVRTADLPWADALQRGHFSQRRKLLGGGERLGCSLWELAPGKRSFPMHSHLVTEEALFVISGHGLVRTPEATSPIGPGDFVAFSAGGPAHQLVNDGTEPLVYVALSSTVGVDVVQYAESRKIAASIGTPPSRKQWIFREGDQADYFDGEPGA